MLFSMNLHMLFISCSFQLGIIAGSSCRYLSRERNAMVRSTLRRFIFLSFGLLLMYSTLLPAQSTYGDVSGTVTDQTGALVPSAIVKLTNQETKHLSTTSSDGDGNFRFVNLDAGQY